MDYIDLDLAEPTDSRVNLNGFKLSSAAINDAIDDAFSNVEYDAYSGTMDDPALPRSMVKNILYHIMENHLYTLFTQSYKSAIPYKRDLNEIPVVNVVVQGLKSPYSKTLRGDILNEAGLLTEGDRNTTYGDPKSNFSCIAEFMTAYLRGAGYLSLEEKLDSVDAVMLMDCAKSGRIAYNKQHRDNYVDKAAYASIAGECALGEVS